MTEPAQVRPHSLGRPGVYDDPELLRRIITVVTSTLDLAELVQGVADVIVAASRTDACFVHLLESERGGLVPANVASGWPLTSRSSRRSAD